MEKKPGWKTTEFWLTLVASLVGLVLASGAISHDPTLQALGMVSSALSSMGYGMSRAKTKSAESYLEGTKALASDPTDPQP